MKKISNPIYIRSKVVIPLTIAAVLLFATASIAIDLAVESGAFSTRSTANSYAKLPISSQNLIVTIQPRVPSENVAALLPQTHSPTRITADGFLGPQALDDLCDNLSALYPMTYRVADPMTIPDELFNAERQQYNIDKLLTWTLRQRDEVSYKTIGVLSVDVYQPDYNFLFGLAKLGGPGCVASTARMGQAVDNARLTATERWHVIVRHELGHAFCLKHVPNKSSLMCYANSLEELDECSVDLTSADWRMLNDTLPIRWNRN